MRARRDDHEPRALRGLRHGDGARRLGRARARPRSRSPRTSRMDGETVAPRVLRSGRPVRVDDYDGLDDELARRLRAVGIRSAVGAPIVVAGRLWGAVIAADGRPYGLPADAEERISGFAQLITDALANADAREQLAASRARILKAGYEERRRLGRDLHDGAQQELVNVGHRPPARPEALARAPRARARRSSTTRSSTRRRRSTTCATWRPASTPPCSPTAGSTPRWRRWPAARRCRSSSTPSSTSGCRCRRDDRLLRRRRGAHQRRQVRRASRAVGGRAPGRRRLEVEVRDDGVGGANPAAGSGLRGLADRVSRAAGALEVASPPGRGTRIHARIALN